MTGNHGKHPTEVEYLGLQVPMRKGTDGSVPGLDCRMGGAAAVGS